MKINSWKTASFISDHCYLHIFRDQQKKALYNILIMKILFLSLMLTRVLFWCFATEEKSAALLEESEKRENTPEDSTGGKSSIVNEYLESTASENSGESTDTTLRALMATMSLREKIGQLFILQIQYHTDGSPRRVVDEDLIRLLREYSPGGIILFKENIVDNRQVAQFVSHLQGIGMIPLFISVDEEGGGVSRLGTVQNVSVTRLPPAIFFGNQHDAGLAYNAGLVLGRELHSLGINMDMAPVADVNTNPDNPVIGNRAYSSDPRTAGEMVAGIIQGFHKYNIATVIKHFPGHGDTSFDTHLGTVVLPASRDRLSNMEFIPFQFGIKAGTDAIMIAHIVMSGISSLSLPASMDPHIITDIIRRELDFDGILISDALNMRAISEKYTSAESAVAGIKAGLDVLLIPENASSAFNALLDAVRRGEITEKRIDKSVYRILRTKLNRKILFPHPVTETIEDVINDPAHQALIKTFLD